jgi:tetratricopeptide (TPR) repeat protein
MRYLALVLVAASLISCNRDPDYLKQKYLQSGIKYFDAGRMKEANIMFRKSIEVDRKFGPAYYHLALTDLKQSQVGPALGALRRAHELLPAGSSDADDADLKLAEIMIVGAQSQENNEATLKEIQQIIDGFLKRNPNGWQGHKLSGDMNMLATAKIFRSGNITAAKEKVADAIAEYRKALAQKPGDSVITLALGRTLELNGQTAEAEDLFKKIIASDKKNLNGYYALYRAYVSEHKMPEAEAILKTAIANNPQETQLRLTLAQYYFGNNRRNDLIALLNEMKGDLKRFPDAYLESGDFFARANSLDEAIKQYEEGIHKDSARKAVYLKREVEAYVRAGKDSLAHEKNAQILKNDPKDPDARGLQASLLLDKGDVDHAMSELQSVVTTTPNNFVARFNLGRAHFARGEYEEARQQFDTAVQLKPDYIPARLAQTQVALLKGDNNAALRTADATLGIAPNNPQAIVMKAAALQRLQRPEDARKLLESVLAKQPKQEESLLELGVLNLSQKKNKEAEDLFRRAYEAQPTNLRGLMGQSKAILMQGQPDKSVELVEAEAAKRPGNLDLQRELGNAEVSAGRYDKGIAIFQGLVAKVSDARQKSDLWTRIGQAYLRKGDVPESIAALEKARAGMPENASLTTNLAQLYGMEHKNDMARKYYELSIKADPNDALALNNLAFLIAETKGADLDQALTYATKARQRMPEHSEINDTLGWIYLKKNLTDNAIDEFKTLVVKAPQNPTYHYHYAMALLQKGDRQTAKKECLAALAENPSKEQQDAIHQLMIKIG